MTDLIGENIEDLRWPGALYSWVVCASVRITDSRCTFFLDDLRGYYIVQFEQP
jgi:hypothetical protein